MSKTSAAELPNTPNKRARMGVGTSVAAVDRKETDQFILCMTQIKVERLQPKTQKVVKCERGDALPTLFKLLVENNVLAVPVMTQKGEYHGMAGIADIVRFVTNMFSDVAATSLVDLDTLFKSDTKFNNTAVSEIMQHPLQKANPFHPVSKGYSLFSAWEILALSNARRVPVIDPEGHVADLVTQSMLIDFLWQNIEKIGTLADKKVQDIHSMHTTVNKVEGSVKAIVAFRSMISKDTDHLAIVDSHGKLVGNLSLRDLRGVRPDVQVFYRLWNSVTEYKTKEHEEYSEKTPAAIIHVLPTDTLYKVVELMAIKHVHHVFVVNSETKMVPERVITQTDVMREILGRN